ncbi:LuxR C-terminal-related transcriptional regulator [Streptomyces fradiae]|uniref:LuxR C-terminal-related transcriptional regulator n=1 Tax=Streptomyces fradiae TaxID=1906 RepID=UPI002941F031|nr:LuxR C-terminal-related transcriptional regulator [Streptomyces fradiae]WOI61288.1 LuxR C-terminal-related transcriptional regulator [Streptomyces fradiae]
MDEQTTGAVGDEAARLTGGRAPRLLRAAERARLGGRTRRALALLAAAHGTAGDDDAVRARARLLRGLILLGDGPVADAHETLLLAAEAFGPHDAEGAEQALAAAAEAAWAAGDLTAYLQTLERPAGGPAGPLAGLVERPAPGTPPLPSGRAAGTGAREAGAAVGAGAVGPGAMGPEAMGAGAAGPEAVGPEAMGPEAMGPGAIGPGAMGPGAMGPRAMGTDVAVAPWGAFRAGMRHVVLTDFARAAREMGPLLAAAAQTQRPEALLYAGRAALVLGELGAARRLLGRALAAAGAQGGPTARILEYLAYAELRAGLHHQARAHAEEGLRAARRLGQRNIGAQHHALLALVCSLVGADSATEHHAEAALAVARPHGLLQVSTMAEWARARADLGQGRAGQAAVRLGPLLRPGPRRGHFGLWMLAVPCLVEATVLAGLDEDVTGMVDLYAEWAALGADPQARAQLTRLRALTAREEDCDALYRRALEEHEAADGQFEHARTFLSYGMWLRRRRRLLEARHQLRAALVGFERCGALLWEKRTQSELRAAGESALDEDADALGLLTPQQRRVATLVASGATNREVATRLSLSPRTVDHHLRNVFSRLGVRSRVELALLMNGDRTERSAAAGDRA